MAKIYIYIKKIGKCTNTPEGRPNENAPHKSPKGTLQSPQAGREKNTPKAPPKTSKTPIKIQN